MDWKNLDQKSARVLMITRAATTIGVVASLVFGLVALNKKSN